MAEEIKRKVKIRGGHRASAKRIMTLAEESLTTFDPKNPDRVTKVKQQLATRKEKMKTLSEHDEAILNLIEEEIPGEIEQLDIFREKLQHCIVCIEATLEKVANVTSPVGHTTGGLPLSSSNVSGNISHSAISYTVSLPKLSLKKFSGGVTKWTTF